MGETYDPAWFAFYNYIERKLLTNEMAFLV